MKVYLAGVAPFVKLVECAYKNDYTDYLGERREEFKMENFYALESFFYVKKANKLMELIPKFKGFLLDSGAFTFRQNSKIKANWEQYTEEYADFINHHNIKLFFELDIDTEIGYDRVLVLRNKLEKLTNKQCIPVWHKNRGKEEFIKMCQEYPYVAIGGLVGSKNDTSSIIKYLPWFIDTAHKNKAMIHGLGLTAMDSLKRFRFDSVDSTSWTTGNRFGKIYKFHNGEILKFERKANQQVKMRLTAVNNFCEWTKFSNWADTHL